jgi:hypothetical protein
MVVDRQSQAITHEIDVALDRLGGDFQLRADFLAVGKAAGLQRRVQPHHSLKRRPRKSTTGFRLLL